MPHVELDAIARVEYEPAEGVLFVRFTSGEWYAYLDVEPEAFARMIAAPSKGLFFQQEVRDRYAWRRLTSLRTR